jgi:xanthine dehydrogenase YagS FAD-binding subunit
MNAFSYASPTTLDEAVKLLSAKWGETEVLAGGTDLVNLLKQYVVTPRLVVNIKNIAGIKGVQWMRTGARIGALTTLDDLVADATLTGKYPALVQAVDGVRSMQLRAVGTVGGDLLRRPACWFFRNGHGLLGRVGGKSGPVDGDNRFHAILGNSGPAYFVSGSSLAPVLISVGAKARIVGPGGDRTVDLADLYQIPQNPDQRENTLKPNEVLTHVIVDDGGWANGLYEARQRESLDEVLASAAAALKISGGSVSDARITLGGVAPIPWPSKAAADAIRGKAVTPEAAEAAGAAAVAGAKPLSMNAYKVQLAKVAVKRAILAAAGIKHGGF